MFQFNLTVASLPALSTHTGGDGLPSLNVLVGWPKHPSHVGKINEPSKIRPAPATVPCYGGKIGLDFILQRPFLTNVCLVRHILNMPDGSKTNKRGRQPDVLQRQRRRLGAAGPGCSHSVHRPQGVQPWHLRLHHAQHQYPDGAIVNAQLMPHVLAAGLPSTSTGPQPRRGAVAL
jgi:hypothetical protein